MVRCHIQQHGRARPERGDVIELEAGHLQHHHGLGVEVVDVVGEGNADVAGHHVGHASGLQHVADERRRGRLAVRARHGQDRAGAEPAGDLDLGVDGPLLAQC